MTTTYGWDLSHYDWDRGPVDLADAVRAGIDFMTHKATEGTSYTDPKFSAFIQRARLARVPLIGAYMVLVPGKDPAAQADAFLARLDAVWSGWRDGPFILQIDSEQFDYMTRAPSASEVKTCCNRLWQRTAGRYRPIVYAPQWGYKDTLTGLGYPLWESEYGSNPAVDFKAAYPGDSSTRWAPYSGQVPAILQYGSRLTIGSQKTCDANAYRGTVADLTNLVCPGMGVDAVTTEDTMNAAQEQLLRDTYNFARAAVTGRDTAGKLVSDSWDGFSPVGNRQIIERLDELATTPAGQPVDAAAVADQVMERIAPMLPTAEAVALALLRQLGAGTTPQQQS